MSVVVVGIEHRHAPLEVLERVTLGDPERVKALGALRASDNVQEAVVLSTCLRTEVYAVVDRFHEAVEQIWDLLGAQGGLTLDEVQAHASVRFDDDVAAHLFSVAAGLESAVLGESEVLGQVRRAWDHAREERTSGPMLGELFRYALAAGKRARSETAIAQGTTSFSFAAVEVAERSRDGGLTGATVTVVGAGVMGRGLVAALGRMPAPRRPGEVVVVNRSLERAREAVADAVADAPHLVARAEGMDGLAGAVGRSQVVFSAVEAGGHVLGTAHLETATRRDGGVLVMDLGVPRNVDPAAASLPGVRLLDLEALRAAVDRALDERRAEAERVRVLVGEELDRYRAAARQRGAAPVVSALRTRVEVLRAAELAKRRSQLEALGPGAADQVDAVTRAVLAKVLHDPTAMLRETAGTPRGERLVEALRVLFRL